MIGKFWYGIDHAKHSAKTNDLIQAADLVAQRRKQLKPNVARVLLCLVQGYITANFPLWPRAIRIAGTCASKEDQVAKLRVPTIADTCSD